MEQEKKKAISQDEDKVWITIKSIVNLGNFENYAVEAGFSRTLKPKENPIEVLEEMDEELSEYVIKTTKAVKSGKTLKRKMRNEIDADPVIRKRKK